MQSLKVNGDSLEPSTGNRDNMSITISENRSDLFNQRLGNDKIGITTYPTINPGAVQQPLTHFFLSPSVSNMMETFVNFSFHSPKMDDKSKTCVVARRMLPMPRRKQQNTVHSSPRKPRFSLSQHPQVPNDEQLQLPGLCPSAPRDP